MVPLRTKNASVFLAILLAFTSGCHKQSPALSPEQLGSAGVFDIAQAMKMFYGNYDAKKQASVARLPKDKSSFPAVGEEQMIVRMLFNSFRGDVGAQTLVLLTYAVPIDDPTYYCHACAPIIGMAVFSQRGAKWTMDASNRAVTFAGEFGKPPTDIQLVRIGPNHQAVKVMDVGEGNGETTAVLQLLIPWDGTVNLGLERIVADDDKGSCDSRGGLPCYANQRTVTFIPTNNVEYYDLVLNLTGTDLPISDSARITPARKVRGQEIFKFDKGAYHRVSKQGAETYFDVAVAKQKDPN